MKGMGGEGSKDRGMSSVIIGEYQNACFNLTERKRLTMKKNLDHANRHIVMWNLDIKDILYLHDKILQEMALSNRC